MFKYLLECLDLQAEVGEVNSPSDPSGGNPPKRKKKVCPVKAAHEATTLKTEILVKGEESLWRTTR